MKKLIIIAVIGMLAGVAHADKNEKRAQHIGVGAGALVGGIAGGPPGAILGAVIGGHYSEKVVLADKVPVLEKELQVANSAMGNSRKRIDKLNRNLFAVRSELNELGSEMADLLLERAAFEGLQMEVLYTTGNSELEQNATGRLNRLASLLQQVPDMTVRLDGYADPRGDDAYNYDLSRLRAEAVRDVLLSAGVDRQRIAIHAHGESAAISAATNPDDYAFDRKVRVRLLGASNDTQLAYDPD